MEMVNDQVQLGDPAAAVSPDISEPAVHHFLIVLGPGLLSSSLSLLCRHESDWHQSVVCSEHLQSFSVFVSQG